MEKSKVIRLRVTPAERDLVDRLRGESSVSDFVRERIFPQTVGDSDREAWIAERVVALRKQHPPALARKMANEEWEAR